MRRQPSDESILIREPKNESTSLFLRLMALFFMSFLGFGSYFCFDNPGALQEYITKDMSLTTAQFSYLYSFYAWPNTILCFVGGFLVDRIFGIRFGTSLYALIVFLGQIVFALGSIFNSFWLMVFGRLVFGIGGESLAVAQNYYAVLWFKGKELNMVFGFQLSIARLGSAVNFLVMEHVYNFVHGYLKGRAALGVTLLSAASVCLFSFICAIVLAFLDAKGRKTSSTTDSNDKEKKVVRLTDALYFSPSFWMVTIICITYYVAIFPFIALGKVFFMRKFGFTSVEANVLTSFVYIMSSVVSPILGYLVDKTGRNIFWVFVAIMGTIGSHALLGFTFENPYYAVTLLGLAYSMCASALWPMIALVIPEYQLGSAYGVAQSLQNMGLAVSTMIAGMVVDSGGYFLLEMFFLCWLFVTLIVCLSMWIYDTSTNGILNMSVKQRALHESRMSTMNNILITEDVLAAASSHLNESEDERDSDNELNFPNRYRSRMGDVNNPPVMHTTLR